MDSRQAIASTPPAAPIIWPVIDLVALTGTEVARDPNTDLIWNNLESKIIKKLSESDIKVILAIAGDMSNPALRVQVELLKLEDVNQYVFCSRQLPFGGCNRCLQESQDDNGE